jgi:hypothetical protein
VAAGFVVLGAPAAEGAFAVLGAPAVEGASVMLGAPEIEGASVMLGAPGIEGAFVVSGATDVLGAPDLAGAPDAAGAPGAVAGLAVIFRLGAASEGAASAPPMNENTTAEERTPTARVVRERRLLTAPPHPRTRFRAALPQGAAMQIEPLQLHRQGSPRTRAT